MRKVPMWRGKRLCPWRLDQNAVYYVSYMSGLKTNGQIDWQCENMVSKPGQSRFVSKNGKTYLRIVGLVIPWSNIGTQYTWYLDDIAVSAAEFWTCPS